MLKLTGQQMVKLGNDLVRPRGKQRKAIDAIPAARALVPTIVRANSVLVLSQPPTDSEIAKLTSQITLVDVRHDDLVRAIDGRLEAEHYATIKQATRERIARLRVVLFASGRGIIQASYMHEAGEVPFRAARVTAEDRKFLRSMKTCEGVTLEALFDELQAVATEIGVLEKRREELGEEGELVVKNRAARYQWIRAINALIAVLESEGADPTPIVGAIRKAESKGEAKAERGGVVLEETDDTEAEDVAAEDTAVGDTGDEDDLDPPAPTDLDPVDAES